MQTDLQDQRTVASVQGHCATKALLNGLAHCAIDVMLVSANTAIYTQLPLALESNIVVRG